MNGRSVLARMNFIALSTASVPLISKLTRARGSGAIRTSFSASSTTSGAET
jgi:hypothetical protein